MSNHGVAYRMPAEWEPQEAIWLSWPLNPAMWPKHRVEVTAAVAKFAAIISRYEKVRINAAADAHEYIRAQIAAHDPIAANIELFPHPTNDAWCRDHGPVFVKRVDGSLAAVRFRYNAWGGKFAHWALDAEAPVRMAASQGAPLLEAGIFGEGGGIEANGCGDLILTESVWLNPNRNPGITKPQIETVLARSLGIARFCWLAAGMRNDETDGHADTLARFCAADSVLAVEPDDPRDPNYESLHANIERLRAHTTAAGRPLRVALLPMPAPIPSPGWRYDSLPATYANFLILNGAVIVPTYRQPRTDALAAEIIASSLPDRTVIPLDCADIIREGGAWHCLSQQQPASSAQPGEPATR